MLLKWKCSMSFALYVLLHSGPSNTFFLHLGISLKSSKENSLGNLERYVGPYDGTMEVRPFTRRRWKSTSRLWRFLDTFLHKLAYSGILTLASTKVHVITKPAAQLPIPSDSSIIW